MLRDCLAGFPGWVGWGLAQLALCFGCCGALRSDFGLCGFVWLGACFVLVCVCVVLGFRFAVLLECDFWFVCADFKVSGWVALVVYGLFLVLRFAGV